MAPFGKSPENTPPEISSGYSIKEHLSLAPRLGVNLPLIRRGPLGGPGALFWGVPGGHFGAILTVPGPLGPSGAPRGGPRGSGRGSGRGPLEGLIWVLYPYDSQGAQVECPAVVPPVLLAGEGGYSSQIAGSEPHPNPGRKNKNKS